MIDASAIARVLGISVEYRDLRAGGILYLPQRIAVIAQGATAASYPLTKYTATSASAIGTRFGFGSPAHLIARQLLPANGDGVGTIPVTIYPLDDHGSGVAATGGIVPSGTQTEAAEYRVLVNNIASESFVVAASATVAARIYAAYNAINAVLEMPVIASMTTGSVTAGSIVGTGNGTITALSATAGTKPGIYSLAVNTAVANGGVWTLTDPDGVVLSTSITMTPGVGAATPFTVGGLSFTLTDGATDFGLNASFAVTIPVTNLALVSKWKGISANGLVVAVDGEELGTTWTITQPVGGLVNPTVDAAIALVGNVWETMVINALNIEDTTALNAYQTFGEGRWGQLVRKPLVVFTGVTDALVAAATTISSARRTDRVNAQLVSPGSDDLPFVVAARQVARIAKVANNNPPTDYGSQRATGLTPGADGDQWDYADRDLAVKAGSSTVEVKDGVVNISDVVTFYRPTGEEPPAYRYVVDIVKLQTIIFNLDLIFAGADWNGAPLIPDDQPTVNPNARKPKSAVAAVSRMIDQLALNAIISDPKTAKASVSATISSTNAKRLDVELTVALSGNTNIISCTLAFGMYFPQLAAA